MKKRKMYETPQILHDEPLRESDNAFFHFDDFAVTIARLIADKGTRTPLTIAINGARGSGKTTLLRKIKQLIDQTILLNGKRKPNDIVFLNPGELPNDNYRPCKTIWFNARRYSSETEIIAALLRVIVKEFQSDGHLNKVMAKMAGPTTQHDICLLLTALSRFSNIVNFDLDLGKYRTDFNISSPSVFFDYFDETFDILLANWVHGGTFEYQRIDPTKGCIVIFIDDLDKCLPEKIIQMLVECVISNLT
jgi:Cdc6-like AAA superfamily ATPase